MSQKALELADAPSSILNVKGIQPRDAIRNLKSAFMEDPSLRQKWKDQSTAAAVMGNCPKTRKEFRAGITAYCEFALVFHGNADKGWPPQPSDLIAWSHTFQCLGTFCNYDGHVRTACLALGLPEVSAFHPPLKRAKGAVAKRMVQSFTRKPRVFMDKSCVYNMQLAVSKGWEEETFAKLYLAAYTFMLRVPSEALPMQRGGPGIDGQSVVYLENENTIVLRLASRKNRPAGDVQKRKCSCRLGGTRSMCPVHALWHDFFEKLEPGEQPWQHLTPKTVVTHIRSLLTRMKVDAAQHCGWVTQCIVC